MNFKILIFGSDVNAYYMARCAHEEYNIKSTLVVNFPLAYTTNSDIVDIIYNNQIWDENVFVEVVNNFSKKYSDFKILVIASNETYVEFLSRNVKKFYKNVFFNYPSTTIVESFTNKEIFYKTYENSNLKFPKTYYYDTKKDSLFDEKFSSEIILKPANVVKYNHVDFEGKKKVYKLKDISEVNSILSLIKLSGYDDKMIIQEYIPGDDSHLFDCVVYCDKSGRVVIQSFAQIGLQEHAPNLVGNAAVVINGVNTFGTDVSNIVNDIKKFMEDIKYTGFAEFDLKYDERDSSFKVMEINARQGRCSYYVCAAGYNLVKCLVDDLLFDIKYDYTFIDKVVMLRFVDRLIINKYIKNKEYKKLCSKLYKQSVNPLVYSKDHCFKRKLLLIYRNIRYHSAFFKYKW